MLKLLVPNIDCPFSGKTDESWTNSIDGLGDYSPSTEAWSGIHIRIFISISVRQGLELVQSEWNILKMGNPKYIGQCKLVRFKTIYIESVDTGASIPLMTDGVINVSLIFKII